MNFDRYDYSINRLYVLLHPILYQSIAHILYFHMLL